MHQYENFNANQVYLADSNNRLAQWDLQMQILQTQIADCCNALQSKIKSDNLLHNSSNFGTLENSHPRIIVIVIHLSQHYSISVDTRRLKEWKYVKKGNRAIEENRAKKSQITGNL